MSNAEDKLIQLIQDKVSETWKKNKQPYLLSSVGSDFKNTTELKEALNGKRLKEWTILNKDKINVEICTHPTQVEKIGLIPKNETYDYTIEKKITATPNKSRRLATINFLLALGELSPEDADKVVIPSSVLSKLLGEK